MRNKKFVKLKRFKRIYIEITNKCNFKCAFCPQSSRTLKEISEDEFRNVLQKINGFTDYIYLHVKGEPLLHSELKGILDIVTEFNLKVIITTNGSLLKQKLEILKNAKCIRQINVSIHSIEQNVIGNLSCEDYMKDVMDSIDEIVDSNGCFVSYRLWNMQNMQEIEKNLKLFNILAERYKIENIMEQASKASFVELGNKKYINMDTVYEWPSMKKEVISLNGTCFGLIDQLAILVDGTIVPCCLDQEADIVLGNIFEDNIEEVLNNKQVQAMIEGFKNNKLINPLCQRCGFRENKRR